MRLKTAQGNSLLGWSGLRSAAGADEAAQFLGRPKQVSDANNAFQRFKIFIYDSTDEFGSPTQAVLTFLNADTQRNPNPPLGIYRLVSIEFGRRCLERQLATGADRKLRRVSIRPKNFKLRRRSSPPHDFLSGRVAKPAKIWYNVYMRRVSKKIHLRPSLFWDVDPKTIDFKKHTRYVIERILDFGTIEELRWLVHYYSPRTIKRVLNEPRSVIFDKSRSLWSLIFQ